MSFLDAGLMVLRFLGSPGAVMFYGFFVTIVALGYGIYRSEERHNTVAFWVFYWVVMVGYVFLLVTAAVWISNGGGW